jgi:hypothetical protein
MSPSASDYVHMTIVCLDYSSDVNCGLFKAILSVLDYCTTRITHQFCFAAVAVWTIMVWRLLSKGGILACLYFNDHSSFGSVHVTEVVSAARPLIGCKASMSPDSKFTLHSSLPRLPRYSNMLTYLIRIGKTAHSKRQL